MSDLSEKVFRGGIYNYAGKFGTAISSILAGIYIIRKFSVSDYGIYNILANLVTIALTLNFLMI